MNMEMELFHNGFFILAFSDEGRFSNREIFNDFNSVGEFPILAKNCGNVYLYFRNCGAAAAALMLFKTKYNVRVVKPEVGFSGMPPLTPVTRPLLTYPGNFPRPIMPGFLGPRAPLPPRPQSWYVNPRYSIILSNLPEDFTSRDVRNLVEGAEPIAINSFDYTQGLNVRFCHILLPSQESVDFLIRKLSGLIILGHNIVGIETDKLINLKLFLN